MGGGGGGGGKGGGGRDNSMELYNQQQADLARKEAEQEAELRAKEEAEMKRRDELRKQMLGEPLTGGEEEDTVQTETLG